MRKDPTAFRQRFAAWKNGKLPYKDGLPAYDDGTNTQYSYEIPFIKDKSVVLTNAGVATGARLSTNLLDSIADNAEKAGLPIETALGIAVKESTLGNPTDDRSMRTLLSKKNAEALKNKLEAYGVKYKDLFGQHINPGNGVKEYELVNYHRPGTEISSDLFRETNTKNLPSVLETAFRFYKQYPNRYNPGLKNYLKLVDKRGEEVMRSPEVLKWLKERNVKKIVGRFARVNPLLKESKFNKPVYKDGKLPEFKDGTPWGDTKLLLAVKEWVEDWKTRTTAAGKSKVLLRWNATGSKPKPESSSEYTKRRIAEETKMTPVTRAVGKVMDIPTVANATPGTSTGYAAFGLNMPQQQSTVGNEIGAFLDAAFAPQMPGDIVKAYNFVRNIPKKYIAPWMISREMKKALNKTELDIPQRYILKDYSFGDDGTISSTAYDLVDALFGTRLGNGVVSGRIVGGKGRPVGWIESQNKAHGVTEDVYNVAVEDALRLGELGVESGWDLMSPEKTLNVTKKFPHKVIGESEGNPVRLLTNTTNKLKPRYINSSNHNVFKNDDSIVFNEKTGDFELKDNTVDVPSVFDLYNKVKPINSAELFPHSYAGLSDLGDSENNINLLSNLGRKLYPKDKFPNPQAGLSDLGDELNTNSLVSKIPKMFDYEWFNNTKDIDKFNTFFEKVVDEETKIPYYLLKPQFKDRVSLLTVSGVPYGYRFRTNRGIEMYNSLDKSFINPEHDLIYSNKPNRRDLEEIMWRDSQDLSHARIAQEEAFRDRVLPKIEQLEDSWKAAGMPGDKPKLYSEEEWKNMSDADKVMAIFTPMFDDLTKSWYYMPKSYLKGIVKKGGETFYNAGLKKSPYGDQLLGDIPESMRGKVIYDESELPGILGYERLPNKHQITKPALPEENLDWSEWRDKVSNLLSKDLIHRGPLSYHLTRSGIEHPKVLLDYMLSPELAWNQVFTKATGLGDYIFKRTMNDAALQNISFFKSFEKELKNILSEKNIPEDIKINFGADYGAIKTILTDNFKALNISKDSPADIFDEAFERTLRNNKNLAKDFYEKVERNYDNAFAMPSKGFMFISPKRKNFARVVSHEFGHLEDVNSGSYEMPGVVESSLLSERPTAKTPLFKKAFDLNKSNHKEYLGGQNESDATEMAQRATLIADYLKLQPGDHITPEKLKYAMEHYVEDTGMDNNMTDFFNTIIDVDAAAKWMDIFHKALIPTIFTGTVGYKLLKPVHTKKTNTQNELRNK